MKHSNIPITILTIFVLFIVISGFIIFINIDEASSQTKSRDYASRLQKEMKGTISKKQFKNLDTSMCIRVFNFPESFHKSDNKLMIVSLMISTLKQSFAKKGKQVNYSGWWRNGIVICTPMGKASTMIK